MFPIPSGRKLSLIEIAKYWSREIKPPASPKELRNVISKAWWRGELLVASGPSRPKLLGVLYSHCADYIAFAVPDVEEPRQARLLSDGQVEVFQLVRVPLPNADPDSWSEANCTEAFEAIAKAWDEKYFDLIAPTVASIVLTQHEFTRWISEAKYQRATFWGDTSEKESEQQPSSKMMRSKRTKHVQFQIKRAAEALAKEHGGKFPPDDMPVFERDKLIIDWLAGDDDPVRPSERTLRSYFNKPRT